MSWFDKLMPSRINTEKRRRSVPEGLWVKCEGCSAQLYRTELKRNLNVCPKCAHHHYIGARERLNAFLDPDSAEEIGANLEPQDPLKFKDSKRYRDRLSQAQKATGERDALIVMSGALKGMPVVAAAFEFHFMAGSMGSVVGERFARGVYRSIEQERPFVCFAASGGARMQESLYSLLQMGKTSAALAALAEARLPYISVMTDPTTGGVSASLAFLGDVNIAEPGALIGFAGPRVIEQTVKETLPDGFQRAEFLLEKGALDMIVDRRRSRDEIAALLTKLTFYRRSAAAAATAAAAAAAAAKPTAAEAPPQTLLEPSGGSAASSEPSPSADAQTAAGGQRAADAGKARPAKVRGPKLRRSRGRAAAPEPDPRTAPAPAPGQPNSGDNAPSPQAANPPETAAPTDPPGAPSTRDAGAAPPPDAHGAIPARAPGAAGAVPSDARGATSREAPGGGQADPGTSPDAHDMSRQSAGTAGTAGAAGSPAPAGAERLRGTAAEPPREDRLGPEGRSGVTPGHDPSGTPGAKLEVRRGDAVHGDAGSETHEPGAAHEADAAYEPGTRAADHEATGGPPPPNAGGRAQPSGHAAGAAAAEPPGSHAEPPSSDGEPPGSYVEPPSSHMEPGPHAGSAGATGSASAPGRTGGIAGQPPAAAGTDDARSSGPSGNAGSPSTPAASVGHASTQGAAPPQDQATSTDEGTPSGQAPSASPITSSRQATPSDKATSSDQTTPSGQAAPPSGHPPAVGEGRPASQFETPEPGDAGRGGALDEHAGDGRPGDDPERRAAARTEASPHRDAAGDSDSSSHES